MPTAAGPNSNEQGLVFAIDLGDIKNSYVGEPTTNIVTNPTFLGTVNTQSGGPAKNWVFSGETTATGFQFYDADTAPIPLKFPEEGAVITKGPNAAGSNRRIYINTTLLPNTTYTFSCWMYFGKSFGSAWSQFQYDSSNTNLTTSYFPAFSTFAANNGYTTGEWFRWEGTLTTEPTASWCYIGPVISKGADCLVAMQRMQMEIKPHSTSFVNGARSSTQGLLDLTGNTTPDVSNMSFDANSQLVFDGTDDGINVGNAAILSLSNGIGTVEAVVKFPSTWTAGSQYPNLISKGATAGWDTDGWALFGFRDWGGPKSWGFGMRNGGTNRITSRNNCPADVYLHIVATIDGSTIKLYENGVLYTTNTQTINPAANNTNVYIGRDASSQRFPGEIPVAKIYNRTLSAEEVANNYNVLKKRFNI